MCLILTLHIFADLLVLLPVLLLLLLLLLCFCFVAFAGCAFVFVAFAFAGFASVFAAAFAASALAFVDFAFASAFDRPSSACVFLPPCPVFVLCLILMLQGFAILEVVVEEM